MNCVQQTKIGHFVKVFLFQHIPYIKSVCSKVRLLKASTDRLYLQNKLVI